MENWLLVKGFEGMYEVSDMGNVRSTSTRNLFSLKPHGNGYVYVGLSKDGEVKHFRVHRLVAIAFIPNPNNKPYVNHKKGIKHDNRATELEWSTASENDVHAYQTGLRVSPKYWTGKKGADHNRSLKVEQLSMIDEPLATFGSIHEAEVLTSVSHQNIIKVCKQQRRSAGGYKWRYIL